MRQIWKYEMPEPGGSLPYQFPLRSKPVHIAEQAGKIMLWCEVVPPDSDVDNHLYRTSEPVTFYTFGTGWGIPHGLEHLGTVVDGMDMVWHVYTDWATENDDA